MTELFLEYTDDVGDSRRVKVSGERSFVGRHSESDVYIPDGRLSRRHLQIERVGDSFIASDAGSSNGTVLNGSRLYDATALKDGDMLDLGGLTVKVVLRSEEGAPQPVAPVSLSESSNGNVAAEVPDVSAAAEPPIQNEASVAAAPVPAVESGSNAMLLWIAIPVFGIVFIFFAGAILFLVLSGSKTTATKQTDPTYGDDIYTDPDDGRNMKKKETEDPSPSNTPKSSESNSNTGGDVSGTPQTGKLTETAKIEQNGTAFLRKIAQNDPRAFLTTEQAGRVSTKIKQLSGSSAVADNLKSAAKNSAQLKSLAESKHMKPQFLAIAAVSKLGNSRGDVLQTAQGMTEVLDKLVIHLGSELADDSLLVIAAYGQGAAGDTMKLRNMLQTLANKSSESSRVIRTIWFLQKNGNITQAEFDNALNFLAIGTIAQNPKDFGVNAEPLTF